MIIRKICQECKLLLTLDKFSLNSKYADGHSYTCKNCEPESEINNNLNLKVMPTLKEKREAAAAAAAAKVTTPAKKEAAPKVEKEVAAPKVEKEVAAPKVEKEVAAPKVEATKTIGKQGIVTPRKKSEKRKIDQVDLVSGKVVKTFDTVMDAGKALTKSDASIRAVLAGRAVSAYGFDWKFSDQLLYPELAEEEAAAAKVAAAAVKKAEKAAEKAAAK